MSPLRDLDPAEAVLLPELGDICAEPSRLRVGHRRVELLAYPLAGPGEERIDLDPFLHERDPDRPKYEVVEREGVARPGPVGPRVGGKRIAHPLLRRDACDEVAGKEEDLSPRICRVGP